MKLLTIVLISTVFSVSAFAGTHNNPGLKAGNFKTKNWSQDEYTHNMSKAEAARDKKIAEGKTEEASRNWNTWISNHYQPEYNPYIQANPKGPW